MSERTAPHRDADFPEQAWNLLLDADMYGRPHTKDPWQFAVQMDELQHLGVTHAALRWLISEAYLVHAEEITTSRDTERRFHFVEHLRFNVRSCFLLSKQGVRVARQIVPRYARFDKLSIGPGAATEQSTSPTPFWDEQRLQLLVEQTVVLELSSAATTLIRILTALNENGWPPRMNNPLARRPTVRHKQRLRVAVCRLNQHLKNRRIYFSTLDGGAAMCWKRVAHN